MDGIGLPFNKTVFAGRPEYTCLPLHEHLGLTPVIWTTRFSYNHEWIAGRTEADGRNLRSRTILGEPPV